MKNQLKIFFIVGLLSICTVGNTTMIQQEKQKLVSSVNISQRNISKIIQLFNKQNHKIMNATKKLKSRRSELLASNAMYCYKTIMQIFQKKINLNKINIVQLTKQKKFLSIIRPQIYKSNTVTSLNNIITRLNRVKKNYNQIIDKTNSLNKLWEAGIDNSCVGFLK